MADQGCRQSAQGLESGCGQRWAPFQVVRSGGCVGCGVLLRRCFVFCACSDCLHAVTHSLIAEAGVEHLSISRKEHGKYRAVGRGLPRQPHERPPCVHSRWLRSAPSAPSRLSAGLPRRTLEQKPACLAGRRACHNGDREQVVVGGCNCFLTSGLCASALAVAGKAAVRAGLVRPGVLGAGPGWRVGRGRLIFVFSSAVGGAAGRRLGRGWRCLPRPWRLVRFQV